jgi:hypothetical protein
VAGFMQCGNCDPDKTYDRAGRSIEKGFTVQHLQACAITVASASADGSCVNNMLTFA